MLVSMWASSWLAIEHKQLTPLDGGHASPKDVFFPSPFGLDVRQVEYVRHPDFREHPNHELLRTPSTRSSVCPIAPSRSLYPRRRGVCLRSGSVCTLQTNVCDTMAMQDGSGWRLHHRGAIGTGRCTILHGELRRMPLPRTRLLRPLDPSSGVPHRLGRLRPVAHPQNLVGGAQVLLDRRLRQVQAPGYLGVAQALDNQFQDLSLTGREVPNCGVLVLAQEVR